MRNLALCFQTLGALTLFASIVQSQSAGNTENGRQLYLKTGCYQCHGYAGQGGAAGPRVGATALNAQAFTRYVRRPTGSMPAYVEKILPEQALSDIYAYVRSMPPAKAAKDVPLLNQLK